MALFGKKKREAVPQPPEPAAQKPDRKVLFSAGADVS